MKKLDNMRLFALVEFIIWLLIISAIVFGIRYYHHIEQRQFKSYQIFMNDVDGLIVGSPVRFLGVSIGHVTQIQLVSSDIYVKFTITQKGLELPIGSVATVESSGLGGSKSLEIYPPKDNFSKDKLISSKDSTRLGKVIGLFLNIFRDIDQIVGAFSHASKELEHEKTHVSKDVITPAQANEKIIKLNEDLDGFIKANKEFKKKMDAIKSKQEAGDELKQSKDN